MRAYLSTMREQAFVDIKPGYTDSGASTKQTKPIYSAYTPPAPKKKKKIERTRFRENTHTFRQKTAQAAVEPVAATTAPKATKKSTDAAVSMKPGKKEKIRLGQAPTKTLPNAAAAKTEDAGAVQPTAEATPEPVNPLEATGPVKKSRYSARAKVAKQPKAVGPKVDALAPPAADSAEVADRQTQAGPLGLAGDTSKKKKKTATTTSDKTRLADKNKKPEAAPQDTSATPSAPAPAPAPATAPATQPKQ